MTSKRNSGRRPNLSELARQYGVARSTLRGRLERHGDLDRAVTEPPMTPSQAGRIGARRSTWRHPGA
jgi:transposase-like protein